MAARNRVKDLQAVANCSICQDYFKDPVILKCGHNFCRACITGYCKSGDFMDISPRSYPCPLCKEVFGEGEFQPNLQLRNIVDIAKKIPEPRGRSACKEHGKLLKLFCEVDGTPICLVCRESPTHKEHRVAPADEAALDYKARIQSRLEILKKEREKILSFKLSGENESRELLKRLQTEKQMIVSEFQQLHPFLEEQERLRLAQLEELNKEIEKRRDEYVAKLSEELSSFSSLISEMEQKCQQPASEFLQDIKVTLSRCEREKFQNPVAFSSELKWRIWASSQRNAALKTIVKKFKDLLLFRQHLDKDQKETSLFRSWLRHWTTRLQAKLSRLIMGDQKEMSLFRSWLHRRTTRLQDKLSRLSVGAKRASSEEDLDTDQKKRCLPVDSLSHTDSALSALDSQVQEQAKQLLSKEDLDKAELRSLAPQLQSSPTQCESPREQHQSSYPGHELPAQLPAPRRRPLAPRLGERSSPTATVSHQMQASTAFPWSPEGDSSSMEREVNPLLRQHQHNWAAEIPSTSTMPSWQHSQWPAQYPYGRAWGMPGMPIPPSLHSLAVTLQQQLASPSSVPKAHSEAGVEEQAHTPKPPPPPGDDAPGPPL